VLVRYHQIDRAAPNPSTRIDWYQATYSPDARRIEHRINAKARAHLSAVLSWDSFGSKREEAPAS
jgi:hypothetical protein